VHLATCQRVARAQPPPKGPGSAQHFRIFVLASAARERADHACYDGGVRYRIWLVDARGDESNVGDGGLFGWVAQLTANARNTFAGFRDA
jgi:hypothetical protein